jgi:protein O-mannosyl-transferase
MAAVWKPSWERARGIVTDWNLHYSHEAYYAPLHLLSLMADQAMVTSPAADPRVAKLVNVAFHGVNSVLVMVFLLCVGIGLRPAFLGALIFAVHPVQVGTVAWIAERKNVLFTLFYLAAMVAFVRYALTPRVRYAVAVLVLFVLGLLSKPAAITLPVALLCTTFALKDRQAGVRGLTLLLGAMFSLAAVWGVYVLSTEITYPWVLPSWQYRPLIATGAFWFYVSKLLAPWNLVPVYPRWDIAANLGLFLLLFAAFILGAGLVVHFRRKIDPWVLWGLLFFILNLALVSGLIPFGYMSQSFVADHFLYLPMVGIAIIVARGVDDLFRRIPLDSLPGVLVMVALYAWIGVLGTASVRQTMLWRDPMSVWEAALRVTANSPAVYNNYGLLLLEKGDAQKALDMFRKVAELAPRVHRGYLNMGHAYTALGKDEEAKTMYAKAIKVSPAAADPRVLTARILWRQDRHEEAVTFLEQSVKDVPQSAELYAELGLVYYRSGREEESLRAFSKAIELEPFHAEAYLHKGSVLVARDAPDTAIPLLQQAIRLAPNAEAYNVLGAAYAKTGDVAGALREFLNAYTLRPDHPEVRDNVVRALLALNNYHGAARFCAEAEKIGQPCSPEMMRRIINTSE